MAKYERYNVVFILEAEKDLIDIYKYVSSNDSKERAIKLVGSLEKVCISLYMFPKRGHIPFELKAYGIKDFLEIHYKSYKIIYQIIERTVFIHCILDGRRDLSELLLKRLIN